MPAPRCDFEVTLVPLVIPLWTSLTLYRFEANVRSATVLSIVGAGGIGQPLFENIHSSRRC